LFRDCRILERLLEAVKEDLETKETRANRKGYFGHITSISNKIFQSADHQPFVRDFTSASEEWKVYVNETLAARNATDSVVLGGASPMGIKAGDLLSGPGMDVGFCYATPDKVLDQNLTAMPLEADKGLGPLDPSLPPTHKYAPTANQNRHQDIWTSDGLDDKDDDAPMLGSRDADFDARDSLFLDDDKEDDKAGNEEVVWQERQIVDNSGFATSDPPDWGTFDSPMYPAPPITMGSSPETAMHHPKQNLMFYDLDDDSSSSEDEAQFVPSPTKHATPPPTQARNLAAGAAYSVSAPTSSPPVTSPLVTGLPVNRTHAYAPPETNSPFSDLGAAPSGVASDSETKEPNCTSGQHSQDLPVSKTQRKSSTPADAEMSSPVLDDTNYIDANFWKINWDAVSS
jgi:hypothetical protein